MAEQTSQKGRGVAVLGTGAFGTAVAMVLADAGARVRLWGRDAARVAEIAGGRENALRLPGVALPDGIEVTGDMAVALDGSEIVFEAIPAQHVRAVFNGAGHASSVVNFIEPSAILVALSKGIERGTRKRVSEVLRELVPSARLAVLSGPSHAEEVAQRQPTTVVVAADDLEVAQEVQQQLATNFFRVYTNRDVLGVELGGATKNVVAIASGILDGLGLGDNSKSALLTRGLAEITRLGVALGAQRETFFGLAGVGDLVTTCYSRHGRNRAFGEALGRGESMESYLARTLSVVEGATSVEAILDLAQAAGVAMPICTEVSLVMHEGKTPKQGIHDLMTRSPKEESW